MQMIVNERAIAPGRDADGRTASNTGVRGGAKDQKPHSQEHDRHRASCCWSPNEIDMVAEHADSASCQTTRSTAQIIPASFRGVLATIVEGIYVGGNLSAYKRKSSSPMFI